MVDLVDDEHVTNAVGLNSAMMTGSKIVGPAIAGVLITTAGIGWCFVLSGERVAEHRDGGVALREDQGATVDLSSDFASGGGSLSMGLRVAHMVFILTQFDTIDTVSILLDGEEATEGIGGEGVPATNLDRRDAANLTPFVLVEPPTPGEAVSSSLTIAGIANTFEGTVQYTITDPDGLIIGEGFTTATADNGVGRLQRHCRVRR